MSIHIVVVSPKGEQEIPWDDGLEDAFSFAFLLNRESGRSVRVMEKGVCKLALDVLEIPPPKARFF